MRSRTTGGDGAGDSDVEMVWARNAFAAVVPSAPQAGQLTATGICPFIGSVSNAYFWPQSHSTLISMVHLHLRDLRGQFRRLIWNCPHRVGPSSSANLHFSFGDPALPSVARQTWP